MNLSIALFFIKRLSPRNMNIRLITVIVLSSLLALVQPLSAQKVQHERKNGKSNVKERPTAELSVFFLEYNPILKKIDTLHTYDGRLPHVSSAIRGKKNIDPIYIINDDPPSLKIVMVGEKNINATDFVFSLPGYECLSPNIFPFDKDSEHTNVVFVRKSDRLFYQKIGNNTAKKLNELYWNIEIKKLYSNRDSYESLSLEERVVLQRLAEDLEPITMQFEPGSAFLNINDKNGNIKRISSALNHDESITLVIDLYECTEEEELIKKKRRDYILNQLPGIMDLPKERFEFHQYFSDDATTAGRIVISIKVSW